jgi:hypothetical protein
MEIDELSNEGCIDAVSAVGIKYIQTLNLDANTSVRFVQAGIPQNTVPDWIENPRSHPEKAGPLAREVLRQMLEAGGLLQRLARAEIDEQSRSQGQSITGVLMGGMFLMALASKLSYSRQNGIEIAPGFPQLAEVLDKVAKILSSVTITPNSG